MTVGALLSAWSQRSSFHYVLLLSPQKIAGLGALQKTWPCAYKKKPRSSGYWFERSGADFLHTAFLNT